MVLFVYSLKSIPKQKGILLTAKSYQLLNKSVPSLVGAFDENFANFFVLAETL